MDFPEIPLSDADIVAMELSREHNHSNTKIIFKIGPQLTEISVNINKKIIHYNIEPPPSLRSVKNIKYSNV